jgi:hypothetical protein
MTSPRRRPPRVALTALAALCCALPALARAQPVAVKDAWVRAPAPGQKIAAAYMELTSGGNAALVAVASPAAVAVELHGTAVEAGVMKMRRVSAVALPAGQAVKLAPGGLHLMLVDLRRPLEPGDRVPLSLTVERAGSAGRDIVTVEAEVRAHAPGPSHHH